MLEETKKSGPKERQPYKAWQGCCSHFIQPLGLQHLVIPRKNYVTPGLVCEKPNFVFNFVTNTQTTVYDTQKCARFSTWGHGL